MGKQRLWIAAALASLAIGAAAVETRLSDRTHEDLGKAFAEYFQAKTDNKGVLEAIEKIQEEIEKIEKKEKIPSVLALVEDLQHSFFQSYDYSSNVKGKGRAQDETFEEPAFGNEYEYLIHAPKSYNASRETYPLLILIPDAQQTPKEHFDKDWIDPDIRNEAILLVLKMPADVSRWTAIGASGSPAGIDTVLFCLRRIRDEYAVDPDQVFLCGRGAGVEAAGYLAAMYPDLFAGVIGRAGDLGEVKATNFCNTPTFFAGGGVNCTRFAEEAKAEGYDNCTISTGAGEKEIWEWIQKSPRKAHPSRIVLQPLATYARRAYWIELDGFDPATGARADARIDREQNSILIDSEGISSATIYFNDLLVDMGRPVQVVCNGVKREHQVPRSLGQTLEIQYSSGDSGRVYTAQMNYDLPEREKE